MEATFFRKWLRICLFNLLVVAVLGSLMRYKIAYSLPGLPQKNVLNAHSHFAFAGWLTQVLMLLLVQYLARAQKSLELQRYRILLWANLLTAWGMLFSFSVEGYGIVSIIFSTLSILVSYAFAVAYWRDLNRLPDRPVSHDWFKAAVLWNALSSLGPLSLAYLMAGRVQHEHWYLGSIYFFLHFQYNGWFFFACAGLLYSRNIIKSAADRNIFWLFALTCAPAYLLSVLWAHLPPGVYSLTVLAAVLQLTGWVMLLRQLRKGQVPLLKNPGKTAQLLFIFAAFAGSIKFVLQAGSLHPGLAKLAFGFRPIVIGYLHLVLLGLITIFIIAYLKHTGLIPPGSLRRKGILTFVCGIVFQEVLLMTQGAMAIATATIPFISEALLLSALVMLTGIVLLNAGMRNVSEETIG